MPRIAALVLVGLLVAGCAAPEPDVRKFTVTSPAYQEGQSIPPEYTCDGADQPPPLVFAGMPSEARYLAVVLDDPDAPRGTWTHWTFWDLPVSKATLASGADVSTLGAKEGATSAGSVGYHGPCPPSGTHRYIVHAYATAEPLGLETGASIEAVHKALASKAVAQGTLNGTYQRK